MISVTDFLLWILALLVIGLFIQLGLWQMDRGYEKKIMLSAYATSQSNPPLTWQPNHSNPAQYQPIRVQGRFLPSVLLLDNQHHQHQFGFDVISPLVLSNQQVILIDRGWVAADPTRRTWPELSVPNGHVELTGTVYYPSTKNWLLGPLIEKKGADIAIIELIDTTLIGDFLHKSVYPFIIRLGGEEPQGYIRAWPIVAMSPERHWAYAFQWFAMALVIFIIVIALQMKKKRR